MESVETPIRNNSVAVQDLGHTVSSPLPPEYNQVDSEELRAERNSEDIHSLPWIQKSLFCKIFVYINLIRI